MRGQVVRPEVGLGLDDAPDTLHAPDHVHEVLAEQLLRHERGVAIVEGSRQLGRCAHLRS